MMKDTFCGKILLGAFLIYCVFNVYSCTQKKPEKEDFIFQLRDVQTTILVGEPVTFFAELENTTSQKYTLKHGVPLITLYVYPEGGFVDEAIGSTLVKTVMSPHGVITKTINYKFEEPGTYFLRAFCVFTIDDMDYFIEADTIELTVVLE